MIDAIEIKLSNGRMFLFPIVMGLLFFYFARNVWNLTIIHGLYDKVGIFRLFVSE